MRRLAASVVLETGSSTDSLRYVMLTVGFRNFFRQTLEIRQTCWSRIVRPKLVACMGSIAEFYTKSADLREFSRFAAFNLCASAWISDLRDRRFDHTCSEPSPFSATKRRADMYGFLALGIRTWPIKLRTHGVKHRHCF